MPSDCSPFPVRQLGCGLSHTQAALIEEEHRGPAIGGHLTQLTLTHQTRCGQDGSGHHEQLGSLSVLFFVDHTAVAFFQGRQGSFQVCQGSFQGHQNPLQGRQGPFQGRQGNFQGRQDPEPCTCRKNSTPPDWPPLPVRPFEHMIDVQRKCCQNYRHWPTKTDR